MKIYTRTGDNGETGLYGGQRVRKDDPRVAAYGTLDEANAALGVALCHLTDSALRGLVTHLQSELFVAGADLATPISREEKAGRTLVPRITEAHVSALEESIDQHEAELEPLRSFILPGGDPGAAYLHLARAVLRRAERDAVTLSAQEPEETSEPILRYLNRLADLLFVLARVANHRAGVPDVPWTRPAAV